MSTYSYQALDTEGKTVAGEVTADTASAAIAELETRGLVIQSIQQLQSDADASPAKNAAVSILEQRFDDVLRRRDVLIPALTAFADEMPAGRWKRDVRELVSGLQQNLSAKELRGRHARWLPLLESGIASESTSRTLTHSIEQAVRESETRREFRSALTYPLVSLALAIFVLVALCWMIVPSFSDMFDEFGMELPALTLMLVSFGDEIRFHPVRFLATAICIGLFVIVLLRLWIYFALSTRLLGMFTAGNAANVNAMASFSGHLADLLSINVPLPEALRIAGHASQHRHFQRVAETLALEADRGTKSMDESTVAHNLPSNLIYALTAGPDGSVSVSLLRELSVMYRDRVQERTSWSTGVVGQFAVVAVGVAVGTVVIGLFLPLITLINVLS